MEKADSATLTLVAATNFQNYHDVSADPAERCEAADAGPGRKGLRRRCGKPIWPTTNDCSAA